MLVIRGSDLSKRSHRHYLHQLIAASDGEVVSHPGTERAAVAGAFLIRGNTLHRCEATGSVASVFFEPTSAYGRNFDALGSSGVFPVFSQSVQDSSNKTISALVRELSGIPGNDFAAIAACSRSLLEAAGLKRDSPPADDVRMQDAVAAVRRSLGTARIDDLARRACVSQSRFIHLFTAYAGSSFRRYQLWVRLMHGLSLVIDGADLTEAALEAGFSDFSYFGRTLRENFGVGFREIFRNSRNVHVFIQQP